MSVDRILQLKLIADVNDVSRKMGTTTKEIGKVGRAFRGLASFAGPVALNAAITGVEMLGDAIAGGMEDVRKYDEALFGLTGTVSKLGVTSEEARQIAEDFTAMGSSLGFADDDVIVRGLQALAEETRSVEKAQRWMGVAMDVARRQGIPLEDAIKKVRAAARGSKKAMLELGIEGETAGQRLKDAEKDYAGAAAGYATTTAGTVEVLKAGIGDAFEAIGTEINNALDAALPVLTQLWTEWQPTLQQIGEAFGTYLGKLREFWEAALPAIQTVISELSPMIDNFRLAFETAFAIITGVLDTFTALLNGDVTGAMTAIEETVGTVVENIGAMFGNIVTFAQEIVPNILSAAEGIGQALFDGISGAVAGLAGAILSPIRDGLNGVIRVLNNLKFDGISIEFGGISLPNPLHGGPWDPFGTPNVQLLGASTFQFLPEIDPFDIPELAKGGIVTSPTVALIGERGPEAVVPLDQYGGGGGVTLNMYVSGDPASVEGAVLKALRRYAQANGTVSLGNFRSLSIAR